MSSTVTFSCTPRLGSFVVEIPPMTWSLSGFTEMGCYKPSPATWVVAVCQYMFFCAFFHIPVTIRFRNVVCGCWLFRTPGQSFPFDILRAFISFWECSMVSWCFLSQLSCQLLWKLKRCHCESWWIHPPSAGMPVGTRTIALISGESLETFTSNC